MKFFNKDNYLIVGFLLTTIVIFLIQNKLHKEEISKAKLYQSMVSDINHLNLVSKANQKKIENYLHTLSQQHIIEFGKKNFFKLNELDLSQQLSLCSSYSESTIIYFKDNVKSINEQDKKNLFLGLEKISHLCKQNYIVEYFSSSHVARGSLYISPNTLK